MTTVHVMADNSAKDDKSGRDSLGATPLPGDNKGGSFRTPGLGSSSGSVPTPAHQKTSAVVAVSPSHGGGCDHRVARVAMLASLPPISSPLLFFLPATTRQPGEEEDGNSFTLAETNLSNGRADRLGPSRVSLLGS
uniref:Uncharacterized protein n=1 Tax=Oryza meridionalis TaxID=40149 RepID=A0A0E0C0I6_9ORYZ